MSTVAQRDGTGKTGEESNWLDLVIQQVGSLRYGVVEIIVHDSRVIQIEKTERVRLEKSPPPTADRR